MSSFTQRRLWGSEDVQSSYNRTYSLDVDTAIGSQPGLVSVALEGLFDSPHEASAARLWKTQAYPDAASQFSPPEFAQSALAGAEEATERPGNGCASGEKHVCGRCGKISKRSQELARHFREIHDPPRQCPLCPLQWKRAYKIKKHLIKVHHKEITPVVEGVRILQGQDVIEFVEAIESLRNFELPETTASSTPFLAYEGHH
ncbi:hypothetical protein EDB83DRAFT_741682 [Lactarius deliciosus]|nr:hypothetical protein EDB83DRAFT_741682 [Lactarius deliciosus]